MQELRMADQKNMRRQIDSWRLRELLQSAMAMMLNVKE